jgi:hypothetical protein
MMAWPTEIYFESVNDFICATQPSESTIFITYEYINQCLTALNIKT